MIKDEIGGINFKIKDISDYEIWNGKDWCNFTGIMEKDLTGTVELIFDNNSNIKGSFNHKIQIKNDTFKHLIDIEVGDKIDSLEVINKIIQKDEEAKLYDLLNIEDGNTYKTNNIISHNCAFIPEVKMRAI